MKPAIGHYRLAALSPEILQNLLNEKFNQGYSRNTLASLNGILTGSLSYAVQPLKYIPYSPAEYIKVPSHRAIPAVKTRSAPHAYITPDQMSLIFQRFPEGSSSYLPLLIGYKCGPRIAEAFALEWEDIDFERKQLFIRRQFSGRTRTPLPVSPATGISPRPNMTASARLNFRRMLSLHCSAKSSVSLTVRRFVRTFTFTSFVMRTAG